MISLTKFWEKILNKIIPTIGRVVWYNDPDISDQMCAATVSYVHNEDLVNLSVSAVNGSVKGVENVPLFQGYFEECPIYSCCWMPYQQKQNQEK